MQAAALNVKKKKKPKSFDIIELDVESEIVARRVNNIFLTATLSSLVRKGCISRFGAK